MPNYLINRKKKKKKKKKEEEEEEDEEILCYVFYLVTESITKVIEICYFII